MNFDDYLKEVMEKDKGFKYSFEIENMKNSLIKQVLAYRKENDLTQKELGELIGVKQQVISRFENGNSNVGLDFLTKLTYVIGRLELKRESLDLYSENIELLNRTSKILSIGNAKKIKKNNFKKYGVDLKLWEMWKW